MKKFASRLLWSSMAFTLAFHQALAVPQGTQPAIGPNSPADSVTVAGRALGSRASDTLNVKDNIAGVAAKGDGTTDDSSALIALDAYAGAHGYRYLYFPPGSYYAPSLGVIGLNYLPQGYLPNTILVGDGVLTGDNGYRRVLPLSAASAPVPPASDLIPSQHLKKAATKPLTSALVVDVMGDSTCTPYANLIAPSEYMSPALLQKIQRDNPGRTITFNNRCVGGQSWTNANSTASSNQPSWYTPTSTPWLNFVSADAPDILIFNFGMNPDTNSISLADFHGVLTKVNAFTKVPSVIFITNKQPSYHPTSTFTGYPQDQESRYVTAGFTRTYAKANGYGLLDFNRRMRILRDGLDPVDQHMVQVASSTSNVSLPYTFPKSTQGDYDLQFSLPSTFWSNYSNLNIQLGNRSDNLLALSVSGGTVVVNAYEGTGYGVLGFNSGVTASPGGTVPVEILVKKGRLTLTYNGVTLTDTMLPMMGGPFTPVLQGTLTGSSQTVSLTSVSVGVSATYMPTLTDADIYQSATTEGGNTLNHANSFGVDAIENPVIAASRFSVAEAQNQVNPNGTSNVVMDLPLLAALGGTSGNTSTWGGFSGDVNGNTEKMQWIARRAATGTGYLTAEIVGQFYVDTTAMGAIVMNPYAFPQGVSLRTGGTDRLAVDSYGNVIAGTSGLAASATDGFLEVPNSAAAPTGTPAHAYGRTPMTIDTTNSKACFYVGGAWKCATLN